MADRFIDYRDQGGLTTVRYIELLAAAYCKATDIPPEEATVVIETVFDKDLTKMTYSICRRKEQTMSQARERRLLKQNKLLLACIQAAGFEPWINIAGDVGLKDGDGNILTGHPIDDEE